MSSGASNVSSENTLRSASIARVSGRSLLGDAEREEAGEWRSARQTLGIVRTHAMEIFATKRGVYIPLRVW